MRSLVRPGRFPMMQALIACTLLLRILVPTGWMPQAGAGTLRIALCNELPGLQGGEAAQRLLDAALPAEPEDDRHAAMADQPCAFSGLSHAVALPFPVPSALKQRAAAAAEPSTSPAVPRPGRGLAAPPPPATGPPLLA